jgi:hypothetical protein
MGVDSDAQGPLIKFLCSTIRGSIPFHRVDNACRPSRVWPSVMLHLVAA